MPVFAAFRRFSSMAVLLMIAGSISAFAQCNGTISPLIDGEQSDRFSRIAELPAKGEASILSLLEAMNDSHTMDLDLTNPRSSQVSEQATYCGLVAAFCRTHLGRDHLHLKQGEDFSVLGWDHADYPYWIGEVVTDDGKPIKAVKHP